MNSPNSQTNERKSTVSYWDENWRRASGLGDDTSAQVRKSYVWQRFDRALAKCFGEAPRLDQQLLEMGAGASQWLPYLHARFGFAVTGLDYSEIGCERARERARAHEELVSSEPPRPPLERRGSRRRLLRSGEDGRRPEGRPEPAFRKACR